MGIRFASFDGDADRVVFFTFHATKGFILLDGDKIAVLTAQFIGEELLAAGFSSTDINMGIVQTVTHLISTPYCVCTVYFAEGG